MSPAQLTGLIFMVIIIAGFAFAIWSDRNRAKDEAARQWWEQHFTPNHDGRLREHEDPPEWPRVPPEWRRWGSKT